MNNNEIINAVKCGMKIAAREIYYMDFSSGGKINTEYFATVSIGKSLFSDKKFNIGDNKIIFEYDTRKFITATVPLIKNSTKQYVYAKFNAVTREYKSWWANRYRYHW